MRAPFTHDWDVSWDEARRLQEALAQQVAHDDDLGRIHTIAGIDWAYPRTDRRTLLGRAAVVVLSFPDLTLLEQRTATRPITFPYVPDLLSFRDAPIALEAIAQLQTRPDLLLVDGHGTLHPRRLGIASHLGVLLDLPSVGCAASGAAEHAPDPGDEPGASSPLRVGPDVVGRVVRTRPRSRPLVVSPGHRVSLDTAVRLVLRCVRGRRLPEPTRLAGDLARAGARTAEGG